MKHQNHLLKRYGTVLSRTLLCSTLTFTPFAGVENMMADTSQMAQTHVRGTVVDENGEPIIGANIMVVGGIETYRSRGFPQGSATSVFSGIGSS